MQSRQKQVIEAFQRVQGFLLAHPLPPPGDYGEPKQLLDDAVVQLTEHSRSQLTGIGLKRAGRENEATLREQLLMQHLKPITLIAQAQLRGSPGIEQALRMPVRELPALKLVALASSFHDAAALYEAVFVRSGRPADFLAQLDQAAEALRQGYLAKEAHLGVQVGAAAGMKVQIEQGRRAVMMLDAIVLTAFARQPDVLAEWRSARRVRLSSGRFGSRTTGRVGTIPAPAPSTSTTPALPTAPPVTTPPQAA